MSYDLKLSVKVDGTDIYAVVDEPVYAHPTYNLNVMFRKCMDWDFRELDEHGETIYYNCEEVIKNIEKGIYELRTNENKYKKYNPENGWGSTKSAVETLERLRECIYNTAKEIPIKHLWLSW